MIYGTAIVDPQSDERVAVSPLRLVDRASRRCGEGHSAAVVDLLASHEMSARLAVTVGCVRGLGARARPGATGGGLDAPKDLERNSERAI